MTLTYPLQGTSIVELKNGLLACWEFNEAAGTNANDETSNNYDLTHTGTLVNQTGIMHACVKFDGENDYTKRDAGNDLSPQSAHSISMWTKRIDNTKTETASSLMSRYYSSTGLRIYTTHMYATTHATTPNNIRYNYYDTSNVSSTLYYDPGSDIWTGNWRHIVWTRDGDEMEIFVDSVSEATGSGAGNGTMQNSANTATDDMIGALSKSTTIPDSWYSGYVDQTAVWNIALNQDQVDLLYNGGSGLEYADWVY